MASFKIRTDLDYSTINSNGALAVGDRNWSSESTKVLVGMDTDESAKLLLEGWRLHYNYEATDGPEG